MMIIGGAVILMEGGIRFLAEYVRRIKLSTEHPMYHIRSSVKRDVDRDPRLVTHPRWTRDPRSGRMTTS
jgi:hypothetical protein